MVGLMATSSKRAYAIPRPTASRDPASAVVHLLRRHSTQFCLSLCGDSRSWHAQGMFEPSEYLWWVWVLILNVIAPLLPALLGFSFALGCGVSPQSRCSGT